MRNDEILQVDTPDMKKIGIDISPETAAWFESKLQFSVGD